MKQFFTIAIVFLLSMAASPGQTVKLSCTEKEIKNEEGNDPIVVKTCLIRNFKFVETVRPDYAGRFFFHEYEVYVKKGNKHVKTTNSNVFNKTQNKLLDSINTRIQKDFNNYRSDSSTMECFTGIDSIPIYKMDELGISFHNDEIWFVVQWGLAMVCRNVDGTLVAFKINDIKKYLK